MQFKVAIVEADIPSAEWGQLRPSEPQPTAPTQRYNTREVSTGEAFRNYRKASLNKLQVAMRLAYKMKCWSRLRGFRKGDKTLWIATTSEHLLFDEDNMRAFLEKHCTLNAINEWRKKEWVKRTAIAKAKQEAPKPLPIMLTATHLYLWQSALVSMHQAVVIRGGGDFQFRRVAAAAGSFTRVPRAAQLKLEADGEPLERSSLEREWADQREAPDEVERNARAVQDQFHKEMEQLGGDEKTDIFAALRAVHGENVWRYVHLAAQKNRRPVVAAAVFHSLVADAYRRQWQRAPAEREAVEAVCAAAAAASAPSSSGAAASASLADTSQPAAAASARLADTSQPESMASQILY